ncbi:MAG: aldehyde dehydrogenase family protein, partial [Phycisphaerales bacterium]
MTTADRILADLGLDRDPRVVAPGTAGSTTSENPATGEAIAAVGMMDAGVYNTAVERAMAVQRHWRRLPAPKRGEIVRRLGMAFREKCDPLGELVALEMGKIRPEGIGEVQECIDIADFAVGLSRQLSGPTMPSERPDHRMFEQWHPLGTIGIITAF